MILDPEGVLHREPVVEHQAAEIASFLDALVQTANGKPHLRTTREHLGQDDAGVEVRLGDGRGVRVHQDYAWFVVVEPRTQREIMEE